MLPDGSYGIIEAVRAIHYDEPQTTYNFEVADFHTYYVGNGVLVHNMNWQDCGGYHSQSFEVEGEVGTYDKIRVDVENAGSGRFNMHLQYKSGPNSPGKLDFDIKLNKFVGTGADVFNSSAKVRRAVVQASRYIKGLGGKLHWR